MIRPPITYIGSKRGAMDTLLPYFPQGIRDYREAFLGSGSSLIRFKQESLSYRTSTYKVGDTNSTLIKLWLQIQNNVEELINCIEQTLYKFIPNYKSIDFKNDDLAEVKDNIESLWEYLRSHKPISDLEEASIYCIVIMVSYAGTGWSGGLIGSNLARINDNYFNRLRGVSQLVQGVVICNCSYEETLTDLTKDSFIFLDPPYYDDKFKTLYKQGKGIDVDIFDHLKLRDFLSQVNCKWLMTYDNADGVRELYKDYYVYEFDLNYLVQKPNPKDRKGTELIITNYKVDFEYDINLL